MEPSPGTLTFSSIASTSTAASPASPKKIVHAALSSTPSSSTAQAPPRDSQGLSLEDLHYTPDGSHNREISEDCVGEDEGGSGEDEWIVYPGGGGRWRSSGSVPPSSEREHELDHAHHHHPHALRPKSRSFHQAGRTSPFKRTASSWKPHTPTTEAHEDDELIHTSGLPPSSLSSIPASHSTLSAGQLRLNPLAMSPPQNALSQSLSAVPPPRQTSLPDPGLPPPTSSQEQTPPILSPALSFLSAFSSPRSSMFLPSSSAASPPVKPAQADDQGQPAGETPYVLGRLFGQGGSSIVREVLDATTKQRPTPPQAVKIFVHSPKSSLFKPSQARLAQEIELWSCIPTSAVHLVPLISQSVTLSATFLFMPYMSGGTLFDLVKRHREHDRGRSAMMSSFRGAGVPTGGVRASGMPEGEARRLFKGVIEGLKWLHHEGIVHGDLKAENVLIDGEGRCRLADFGLAVRYRPSPTAPALLTHPPTPTTPLTITPLSSTPAPTNGAVSHAPPPLHKPKPVYPPVGVGQSSSGVHRAHTISSPHPRLASSPFPQPHHPQHHHPSHSPRPPSPPNFPPGSLPYAPPELLRPPPHSPPAPSQDIWSLGVLLFFLLTSGSLPFQDAFEPRLQMKIARGVWEMPEEAGVGRQAEEVLKGCMQVEVERRWGVEEVKGSEWCQGWEEVKPPRSKSRSRSRQRGGGGASGGGFNRDRSHSRGGGRNGGGGASPRDYHPPSSLLPPPPNSHLYASPSEHHHDGLPPSHHTTSPPTHFSRFNNPSLDPPSSSSRSRSRGRDRSRTRDPSTPSTNNTGLSSEPGTPPALHDGAAFPPLDGTMESKSRSRSRSRRRAGGGMETVPEVVGVEHERERGRGRR